MTRRFFAMVYRYPLRHSRAWWMLSIRELVATIITLPPGLNSSLFSLNNLSSDQPVKVSDNPAGSACLAGLTTARVSISDTVGE